MDLFSCAGGASEGYHQAGFEVVGVDIQPRLRYRFDFIQADALALDPAFIASFDVIHASPPCQGYTAMRHAPGAKGAPRLIGQVREMLIASGRPYVIENVEQAAEEMRWPIRLCGSSFGLGAQGCELRRHRLFESNVELRGRDCHHGDGPVIGVYGGHARRRAIKHGGRGTKDVWGGGHRAAASEAMQMSWATLAEMSEAIPPAYTKFIGAQLLAHIQAERLAA